MGYTVYLNPECHDSSPVGPRLEKSSVGVRQTTREQQHFVHAPGHLQPSLRDLVSQGRISPAYLTFLRWKKSNMNYRFPIIISKKKTLLSSTKEMMEKKLKTMMRPSSSTPSWGDTLRATWPIRMAVMRMGQQEGGKENCLKKMDTIHV